VYSYFLHSIQSLKLCESTKFGFLTGSHFCRGTFDGWLCWADTEAGVTVHQPCPAFISGFDPTSEFHLLILNTYTFVLRSQYFFFQL